MYIYIVSIAGQLVHSRWILFEDSPLKIKRCFYTHFLFNKLLKVATTNLN